MPVKIQSKNETLEDAIEKLERASKENDYSLKIVIQTREFKVSRLFQYQTDVKIIKSLELQALEMTRKNDFSETTTTKLPSENIISKTNFMT